MAAMGCQGARVHAGWLEVLGELGVAAEVVRQENLVKTVQVGLRDHRVAMGPAVQVELFSTFRSQISLSGLVGQEEMGVMV